MVAENVADCAGRNVCKLLGGRDDDGLDLRSQPAVGIGNRPFVLEVQHVAYTPDNVAYAEVAAHVNGEPVIFNYLNIVQPGSGLAYNAFLLLIGVEARFVLVDAYCDHYIVEHGEGAAQNIQVTGRKGIERSREKCCFVHSTQI